MRDNIITPIVALAAAKAKAETEDKYNNPKVKRKVICQPAPLSGWGKPCIC